MNLIDILKGHEGETFYSPAFGNIIFSRIDRLNNDYPLVFDNICFTKDGKCNFDGECMLFPSKEQRDWDKWAEEQKPKTPKIWSELISNKSTCSLVNIFEDNNFFHATPIEKSALALLKIHQLIEVGYGGVPTREERMKNDVFIPDYLLEENQWITVEMCEYLDPIAFRTKEQCDEFLSYPDNIKLLEDLYIVQK